MSADPQAILLPVCALALWTFLVLLLVAVQRIRTSIEGRTSPGDYRLGESARVPAEVALPNRNYMNLLELPVLFYVVCLILFATKYVDGVYLALAWGFFAARVVHSAVHLTYNNVLHRLVVFVLGNCLLLTMWLRLSLTLITR